MHIPKPDPDFAKRMDWKWQVHWWEGDLPCFVRVKTKGVAEALYKKLQSEHLTCGMMQI